MKIKVLVWSLLFGVCSGFAATQRVEVYAHSFAAGGWKLDSQFMDVMGSPYLLAHGMGRPVPDATVTVDLPEAGTWRVRARTRNWAPGAPGKFQILVDGKPLAKTFGEGREVWSWENGGEVTVADRQVRVTLRDLTGFDGRCAGVVFERGGDPEEDLGAISVTKDPKLAQTPAMTYDLVVVGGGVPGCCAALAAARRGLRVALVQDRPVLGGNSSSEIRVWSAGEMRYPIVKEMRSLFMNRSKDMWISDEDRLARLQREPNLSVFLSHRAFAVEKKGDRIAKVFALDFVNGRNVAFAADNFVDATGDGWIGFFAGADYSYGREGRNVYNEPSAPEVGDRTTLGASIMWESCEDRHGLSSVPIPFSAPWAEPFAEGIAAIQGRWNWEYGLNRDMISEGEAIRDRLFLAIYGAFSLAKKKPENNRRILVTMPFLIGKRESRRLLGDHVLVEQDVTSRRPFEDAVATGSWSIDLHYTITNATFLTRCEQPHYGRYWIPYRSLYSRNVPNLFLTGRCASYSHVGLGSPRVVNTLAQTGVAVGEAAALCKKYGAVPREIWTKGHTRELQDLLGGEWPGRPDPRYARLRVVDDESEGVVFVGAWNERHNPNGGQIGNISHSRRAPKRGDVVRYPLPVEKAGRYRVYRNVPFDPWHLLNLNITHQAVIESGGRTSRTTYDLWADPGEWVEIGVFDLEPGATLTVDPAGAEMACADGFAVEPL